MIGHIINFNLKHMDTFYMIALYRLISFGHTDNKILDPQQMFRKLCSWALKMLLKYKALPLICFWLSLHLLSFSTSNTSLLEVPVFIKRRRDLEVLVVSWTDHYMAIILCPKSFNRHRRWHDVERIKVWELVSVDQSSSLSTSPIPHQTSVKNSRSAALGED